MALVSLKWACLLLHYEVTIVSDKVVEILVGFSVSKVTGFSHVSTL